MAMQTYNLTAVLNWRGDHYRGFSVEFPINSKGASVQEVLDKMRLEASGYLERGRHPNNVMLYNVPLNVEVQDDNATSRSYRFDAFLYEEDDGFCSFCPEVGTASCGDTFYEALRMIKEATELALQDEELPGYDKAEVARFQIQHSPAELVNA